MISWGNSNANLKSKTRTIRFYFRSSKNASLKIYRVVFSAKNPKNGGRSEEVPNPQVPQIRFIPSFCKETRWDPLSVPQKWRVNLKLCHSTYFSLRSSLMWLIFQTSYACSMGWQMTPFSTSKNHLLKCYYLWLSCYQCTFPMGFWPADKGE